MLQTLQNLQDPCNKEENPNPILLPAIFEKWPETSLQCIYSADKMSTTVRHWNLAQRQLRCKLWRRSKFDSFWIFRCLAPKKVRIYLDFRILLYLNLIVSFYIDFAAFLEHSALLTSVIWHVLCDYFVSFRLF